LSLPHDSVPSRGRYPQGCHVRAEHTAHTAPRSPETLGRQPIVRGATPNRNRGLGFGLCGSVTLFSDSQFPTGSRNLHDSSLLFVHLSPDISNIITVGIVVPMVILLIIGAVLIYILCCR